MQRKELQFKSAEISFHLHATEDYDRVMASIAKALSIPLSLFVTSNAQGHYGNPIKIITAHLIGKESRDFVAGFFASLPSLEKNTLLREMNRSLNEHGDLFIRLDKQELLLGRLMLAEVDPVRIKIKLLYNMPRAILLKAYEDLLNV